MTKLHQPPTKSTNSLRDMRRHLGAARRHLLHAERWLGRVEWERIEDGPLMLQLIQESVKRAREVLDHAQDGLER